MVVGVLEIQIKIDGIKSLKDKRSVVRPLIERMRRNHNVSIAEVDDHDLWNAATIGVSCVSTDRTQAGRILQAVSTAVDEGSEYRVEASSEEYY